ncbi:MAG: fluoride efflux transporter CrcB [Thermoanaerobaculia bacterium]|nr:fluoride efflux transporter CrcB [Thermoanaerobaculia bacterium]
MIELFWVGLGGFVGAILRYQISLWTHRLVAGPFPIGTFVVNVIGCFFIGVLMTRVDQGELPDQARVPLGAGLLGALTTFSTFGYETFDLLREGSPGLAVANVMLNVLVGLGAVRLGVSVTQPS